METFVGSIQEANATALNLMAAGNLATGEVDLLKFHNLAKETPFARF